MAKQIIKYAYATVVEGDSPSIDIVYEIDNEMVGNITVSPEGFLAYDVQDKRVAALIKADLEGISGKPLDKFSATGFVMDDQIWNKTKKYIAETNIPIREGVLDDGFGYEVNAEEQSSSMRR